MTLEALQSTQDTIDEIRVRENITSEKEKLQDMIKQSISIVEILTS